MTLYLLSLWLHILAASTWVGGMVFFAAVVVPVMRRPEYQGSFADLIRRMGSRFRVLGWTCLGLLLVTGTANLLLRGFSVSYLLLPSFWASDFGTTLAHKLALIAVVVAMTAAHDALLGKQGDAKPRAGAHLARREALASHRQLARARDAPRVDRHRAPRRRSVAWRALVRLAASQPGRVRRE